MADKDIEQPVQLEYGRHLTVENGAGLCSRPSLNVDAFIVQLDVAQPFHRILPVMAGYDVSPADGHRQLTAVIGKIAGQLAVGLAHGISLQRSSLCFGCTGSRSRLVRLRTVLLACGSFATGFLRRTFAGFLYLFGNEAVDARIELIGFAAFFGNLVLQTALLLLQAGDKRTFLLLLLFQLHLLGFTLLQQIGFCSAYLPEFRFLLIHLLLLFQYLLTLQTLIGGILAHIAQAAISLRQTLGRENKHQLLLNGAVLIKVLDRRVVFPFLVLQITLQLPQLTLQR